MHRLYISSASSLLCALSSSIPYVNVISPPSSVRGFTFSTRTMSWRSPIPSWKLPLLNEAFASFRATYHLLLVPSSMSMPCSFRYLLSLSCTRLRRSAICSSVSSSPPIEILRPPPNSLLMLSGRSNTPQVLTLGRYAFLVPSAFLVSLPTTCPMTSLESCAPCSSSEPTPLSLSTPRPRSRLRPDVSMLFCSSDGAKSSSPPHPPVSGL
mmetsp:Transcript_7586/g.30752  ORF Transcript_7586/g.30752 Transcript_7586/m.30752 type:complete len:210 (-) Transcript_7586:496-1125(-)